MKHQATAVPPELAMTDLPGAELSPTEIEKYSRQLILRGWTSELQLRLKSITVSIPAQFRILKLYLLAAGFLEQNIWFNENSVNGTINSTVDDTLDRTVDYTVTLVSRVAWVSPTPPNTPAAGSTEATHCTLSVSFHNRTTLVEIRYPGLISECWIAALIISHQRTVNKEIFPVATMLFA